MNLHERLNECQECPMLDYEVNIRDDEKGYGRLGAYIYPESSGSVLVVGQNPSHRRWKGTHSFEGKQGDVFREVFGRENLIFTNFVQISTPDNKVFSLSDDAVKHCINHLIEEIKWFKPKLIIVCGEFAKRKLSVFHIDLASYSRPGTKVVCIYHPDYFISYHRGDYEEYRKHLIN